MDNVNSTLYQFNVGLSGDLKHFVCLRETDAWQRGEIITPGQDTDVTELVKRVLVRRDVRHLV